MNRGLVGMLMTLLLLILSALDVLFFFLPSPIDPKLFRYGEQCIILLEIFFFIVKPGADQGFYERC